MRTLLQIVYSTIFLLLITTINIHSQSGKVAGQNN
jgi:hypothetical protein